MPGMDGGETYQVLRRRFPEIPVIIASGFDATNVRGRFVDLPPNGILAKPFRLTEMSTEIRRAIQV